MSEAPQRHEDPKGAVLVAVLVFVGAAAIVVGTALLCWPAAVVVAGALLLLAGIDLRS